MVDALTKQGLSPQEAQEIATKSAARSLAGWYQEADAVEQMNRERTMRFDAPLPISSIPPRVVLPLNSLHEQMKRIEPIFSVDDAAAKAEQIDNTSAVSVFAKLRHNADQRDRSLLTETHGDDLDSKLREKRSSEQRSGVETDPNKLFGQKQNKASQLPVLPEGEVNSLIVCLCAFSHLIYGWILCHTMTDIPAKLPPFGRLTGSTSVWTACGPLVVDPSDCRVLVDTLNVIYLFMC